MALKLRRQAGVFTNGILLHRMSGRPPDSLRTGADSFKRVLGGPLIYLTDAIWVRSRSTRFVAIAESASITTGIMRAIDAVMKGASTKCPFTMTVRN